MLKEISIEIIRKCPNNCVYCSSDANPICGEIIRFEKFKEVINDSLDLGLQTVCFSGGEPFLHPEIVTMIDYVNTKGLNSYVYTSGIVFDEHNNYSSLPERILNEIAGKVTKLIFNVEAATSETYDAIMGTKNCLELLKESIKKSNRHGIVTEAHFVPMKLNINEISDTITMCEQLGISKISFLRLVIHGRAPKNKSRIALSDEETMFLKKNLAQIRSFSGMNIRIGVPLAESKQSCEAATGKVNIKYNGLVYPCEVFKNNCILACGNNVEPDNIYESNMKDIYRNSAYFNLVREQIERFKNTNTCETCIGQYYMKKLSEGSEGNGK